MRWIPRTLRRMPGWVLVCLVLLGWLLWYRPLAVEALAYKVELLTGGVLCGYIADRAVFALAPGIDERLPRDAFGATRLTVRAVIIAAMVLAFALAQ